MHADGQPVLFAAFEKVVPVSLTKVAEIVKLLENTFRIINIGLVNELARMCDRIGINIWEVIDAAVRFHAVLPRTGLGWTLLPHRSVLSFLEDPAGRHRSQVHRIGRVHKRGDAAFCCR